MVDLFINWLFFYHLNKLIGFIGDDFLYHFQYNGEQQRRDIRRNQLYGIELQDYMFTIATTLNMVEFVRQVLIRTTYRVVDLSTTRVRQNSFCQSLAILWL